MKPLQKKTSTIKSLEKPLQDSVIDYLNSRRIWHIRMNMGSDSGLPDIIGNYHGMFLGIELKRPDKKGKATDQQKKVISDINKSGGYATLIDSIEALELFLKEVDLCLHKSDQEPIRRKFWTS